jgi:hypothetical protein
VFAAGEAYDGLQAKVIKQRAMPGTDGTVRIAGTSLNSRACTLDFRQGGAHLQWWRNQRFARMPFAVFSGVNHGSIIDPGCPGFTDADGPGGMAVQVLRDATTAAGYATWSAAFDACSAAHHPRLPEERQVQFQQFFFRVRDDVDAPVEDYFVDFHVVGPDGQPHRAHRTVRRAFETKVHVHSKAKSHRVFWMNCSQLRTFDQAAPPAPADDRGLRQRAARRAVLREHVRGLRPRRGSGERRAGAARAEHDDARGRHSEPRPDRPAALDRRRSAGRRRAARCTSRCACGDA